ncbi:MAG: FAD-binding oxidoreductase, partial [Hyphomicrobiales bacterium]|nr:FAD-binding oxidoreductase [Hyphomicrobiales bacterium]
MLDKPPNAIDPVLLKRFAAIVGGKYAITDPQMQAPYVVERRDMFAGRTPLVLRPGSVAEVAAILKLANDTATPVVPQGGNTGLVGGQTPLNDEIVLSLNRLDRIREVDPTSNTMTCEAGVTLQRAREAAVAAGRLYPQLLPSEGTCTIGGNLSTNAGGTAALAHGVARAHVLGIEVVLADGRILNGLNKLKKDNTGYDLKNLFIGAEGTLGVITAAVLRLVPLPRATETAFVAVPSPEAALALLTLATERAGSSVTSYELMPRLGLELAFRYGSGLRDPLAEPHQWYVLIELSSQHADGLRDVIEAVLAQALRDGLVVDAAIADSIEQTKAFWRIRELLGEVQRHAGGSIKHDVSVPVAAVPAFLKDADEAAIALVPGARPVPFGHL